MYKIFILLFSTTVLFGQTKILTPQKQSPNKYFIDFEKKTNQKNLTLDKALPSQAVKKNQAITYGKKIAFPSNISTEKLVILDNQLFELGIKKTIPHATVYLIGYRSGLKLKANKNGVVDTSIIKANSLRFIVEAPGYIPAVGYLGTNILSPVLMYKKKRIDTVLKSLEHKKNSGRFIVAKFLDEKGQSFQGISLQNQDLKVNYSFSKLGVFLKSAKKTGNHGELILKQENTQLWNKFFPAITENRSEYEQPSSNIDTNHTPRIVSTTLSFKEPVYLESEIIDAYTNSAPNNRTSVVFDGINTTSTTETNLVEVELWKKSTPDTVKFVNPNYLPTWITTTASEQTLPEKIYLFTKEQVRKTLGDNPSDPYYENGVLFVSLNKQKYPGPVIVNLVNSKGKSSNKTTTHYFDSSNIVNHNYIFTHPDSQKAAISNIPPGEWHLVAFSQATKKILSIQVIRVDKEVVSLVNL